MECKIPTEAHSKTGAPVSFKAEGILNGMHTETIIMIRTHLASL